MKIGECGEGVGVNMKASVHRLDFLRVLCELLVDTFTWPFFWDLLTRAGFFIDDPSSAADFLILAGLRAFFAGCPSSGAADLRFLVRLTPGS